MLNAKTKTTTNTNWCARLLAIAFATSAQAATIYTFGFIDRSGIDVAAGSFTTDGTAVDPGYELLVSMTFDFAIGVSGRMYSGPFTTTEFFDGSAYNPATGAFINHFVGGTFNNLGGVSLRGVPGAGILRIDGESFTVGGFLIGEEALREERLRRGDLAIAPAAPAAVPEPTSMVLLGTGLAGLVVRARRKKA